MRAQIDAEGFLQKLVESVPEPRGVFNSYADRTMLQVRAMDDFEAFCELMENMSEDASRRLDSVEEM